MKMTVRTFTFCMLLALASSDDDQVKTYKLDVPGKEPITVVEKAPFKNWKEITVDPNQEAELKNLMTHIVHEVDGTPRCYGPSCQQGFNGDQGPHDGLDEFTIENDKLKDIRDFSQDRLQAITALAAKLKKDKIKSDRYSSIETDRYQPLESDRYQSTDNDRYKIPDNDRYQSMDSDRYHSIESNNNDDYNNGKVYTTWNRLKVKQHKHPYDDKDGWVTLEPVAWSTSKISKWKPNVKKQKPNHWHEDENRFPSDDRFSTNQDSGNTYNYPQKRPVMLRPGFLNNKLHTTPDYEDDIPSKPSWNKPMQTSYTSTWSPDEGRRPHKPNCDSDEHSSDDTVFYGISDSIVTDNRPSHFPYEYEALHQAIQQKRPMRRPTQVIYAGSPDLDNDRGSRPPYGDGQWVLLSTTKGYRNKKRQRSLNPPPEEINEFGSMTSHQAVALTVLPVDKAHTNMTTSHGGLLEVEKSFQTVEESKRDMDKKHDLDVAATQFRPVKTKVIKRKIASNVSPDSSTILAAVGAGMVPATMAMVVPMMLGRRRRRDVTNESLNLDNIFYRRQ
ncbi:uncharacterized protein LOC128674067 [Plodia interpunctella]|uniref:uncharacterized protein LOC128674067 n=1 Tax=Plodia interpunctella TaxID=58824 RepID=UPI0023674A15|nr:uncharacterized protein LOC128674067 [Plodia interpunctella]